MDKKIKYQPDLKIVNLEQLPRGTGCKYLEVIRGQDNTWIAKQWRRGPVWPENTYLIEF